MLAIRAFFALLILLPFAYSQTSPFPGSLPTDADFTVAKDRAQTALSAALNNSATTFSVVSGSRFANDMILTIDSEQIFCTTLSGATFSGCTRGFNNTTAASHSAGATVSSFYTSYHHNMMKEVVKSITTALGANMANVAAKSDIPLNAADYDFAPQSPGGSLIIGATAITLAPVPPGVNGTNTNHYLWVSGGTGTAEACLITGGSAVSGAASGQLIITCDNTHSGAWTIESATAGIQEAIGSNGDGVRVHVPAGTYTFCGTVYPPFRFTLTGDGEAMSNLKPCTSSQEMVKNPTVADEAVRWHISDLSFDGRDFETNTVKAISLVDTWIGGTYQNASNSTFERLSFDNIKQAFYLDRVTNVKLLNIEAIDNTTTWVGDSTGAARSFNVTIDNYIHHPKHRPLPAYNINLGDDDALITYDGVVTGSIKGFKSMGNENKAVGILVKGACEAIQITDGELVDLKTGIRLAQDAGGSVPAWTKIVNTHVDDVVEWGIDLVDANYTSITGGFVSNNGISTPTVAHGIHITTGAAGVYINGVGFQAWDSEGSSIYVDEDASSFAILNCFFANSAPSVDINLQGGTTNFYTIANNSWLLGGSTKFSANIDVGANRVITGNVDTYNDHSGVAATILKPYTANNLPPASDYPNGVVLCVDCVAGAGCAFGPALMTIAVSDGTTWVCK